MALEDEYREKVLEREIKYNNINAEMEEIEKMDKEGYE